MDDLGAPPFMESLVFTCSGRWPAPNSQLHLHQPGLSPFNLLLLYSMIYQESWLTADGSETLTTFDNQNSEQHMFRVMKQSFFFQSECKMNVRWM